MLTHALASEEEAVPYMERHASKTLKVAGRSAAIEPVAQRNESVFFGWQEALLPLMLSGLVPDDTLFLVFEEDFRFSPEDAEDPLLDRTVQMTQGRALVEQVQQSARARDLAIEAADRGESESCFSQGWENPLCRPGCGGRCIGVCSHLSHANRRRAGTCPPEQQGAEHFAAFAARSGAAPASCQSASRRDANRRRADTSPPEQPGAEHFAAPSARTGAAAAAWSQEVEDLVAYCNLAHKGMAGDIVWLSWCPQGRADDGKVMCHWELTPNHGATCLGVTVRGAIAMSDAMKRSKPKHFDIWLKEALMNKNGALSPALNQFFGASYLWPPTGSYATHKSANAVPLAKGSAKKNKSAGLSETGVRKEDWGYPNQPRTRIPATMDGVPLDNQRNPQQVWHSFQLVRMHEAQKDVPRKIVVPAFVEPGCRLAHDGKVHLDDDMHQCLWWTFAAAAMNDLDKWSETWIPELEQVRTWTSAVMSLPLAADENFTHASGSQGAEHTSAPASACGSLGAEHCAASGSVTDAQGLETDRAQRAKSHRRTLRMQHQWCLHRVDHAFCEARLLYC